MVTKMLETNDLLKIEHISKFYNLMNYVKLITGQIDIPCYYNNKGVIHLQTKQLTEDVLLGNKL